MRDTSLTAAELRAERQLAGLSQVQLAALVGLTKKSVSNYECGGKFPKVSQLACIYALRVLRDGNLMAEAAD